MLLSNLLQGILPLGGLPDMEIQGVAADSRRVHPGFLFVAVRGRSADGHAFLRQAAGAGAAALAGEDPDPGLGLPYFRVPDSRLFLAQLAAAWHGRPGRRMTMIGVTGTDGKTTTCSLLHHILEASGERAGLVTSVGARIGSREADTGFHVTTPDPLALQDFLRQMVEADITRAVVEVTSHGLDQQRVAACEFDIGVLTNITREHLDYHGTYEAYLEAKSLLFRGLSGTPPKPGGVEPLAILNRDDTSFGPVRSRTGVRTVDYGEHPEAGFRAVRVRADSTGLGFGLEGPGWSVEVDSPLLGRYNLGNALAALTAAIAGLGIPAERAAQALRSFRGVPGRMERVDLGQPFLALVDFAHTPNALRRALEAARLLTGGNVIVVYGAAGLRDPEKRRRMPEISIELARHTVLTAEDPRVESLETILADMAEAAAAGGGREGEDFWRVPDRGEALRFAVGLARPGDVVLACGKGHEQSMAFGEVEHPWDDRVALRAALAEKLGVPGPPMPRLPTSPG